MSQINEELQRQQAKDMGEAIRKVFGDIPVIDVNKEKARYLQDRITEELEKSRAESAKR